MEEDKVNYQIKDQKIKDEILELMNNVRCSNDLGLKFYSRILLTDHYKTADVENLFFELLHDERWNNQRGNLIFSLNECIEPTKRNTEYLDFFIHLLLECEIGSEVYMDSVSVIMDLRAPFEIEILDKNIADLEFLLKENKFQNKKNALAVFLLNYLNTQKTITLMYLKMSNKIKFY